MYNIFYVYELIDPRNGLPFYIGKGSNTRMYDHEKNVIKGRIPNRNYFLFNKINKILKSKKSIIYKKLYENLSEKEAFQKESEEIRKYEIKRVGGILCNLSYGGEGMKGYKYTPKQLKKHRKILGEINSTEKAKKENSQRIKRFYEENPNHKKILSEIQKQLWATGKYNNSKHWKFISPEGNIVEFDNLQRFCRENGLSQGNMINVFKGKRNQHKGWR